VTAFRHQSDSAGMMFTRYREFLRRSAQAEPSVNVGDREVNCFSSYGEEIWIFAFDDVFGGVTGQMTEDSGRQLVAQLIAAFQ